MSSQDVVNPSTRVTDYLCGVAGFRPRSLQVFAKPQAFTLVYSFVLILQSAMFYYFFAIMSTLQRRYSLSSWSVAVILFADSASPFFISFAVGHYSRTVSKPLLLFWGVLGLTASCCLSIVPYVVYGPGLGQPLNRNGSDGLLQDLCQPAAAVVVPSGCDSWMSESMVVSGVLFVANCFYGAAYSVLYISGSTYVDDSVKKKNSPLHFAFVAVLKLAGPTLGYTLGSLCLQYYEDPRCESIRPRGAEDRSSLGRRLVAGLRTPGRVLGHHGHSRASLSQATVTPTGGGRDSECANGIARAQGC